MHVLGAMGEADALADAEAMEDFDAAIAAAADDKVMIAEVARPSLFRSMALATAAMDAGYDVLSFHLQGDPERSSTQLLALADRSPLPLLVTGSVTQFAAAGTAIAHPNVIGAAVCGASAADIAALRDRTMGFSREVTVTSVFAAVTRRMQSASEPAGGMISAAALATGTTSVASAPVAFKTRSKRVGFQILALDAPWGDGVSGAMPIAGACIPQACCEIYQAFRDGDAALTEEKIARVQAVIDAFSSLATIAAVKHGCDLNAYFGGRPRLPLLPLTAPERQLVAKALLGIRN
jgi:dihydrodipicolinate synthase/N-acetylneuraminate lyase